MDAATIKRQEKLDAILVWEAAKPTTDADWAEDVKEESLHVKFDSQLAEMETTHEAKISHVDENLDKFARYPEVVRYNLEQALVGKFERRGVDIKTGTLDGYTLQETVNKEFESKHIYYQWKKAKLNQSVKRIKEERRLRSSGFLGVLDKKDNDPVLFEADTLEALSIRAEGSVVRAPIGTTYYIDADNGNDANDGLGTGGANAWASLDQFTENSRSAGDIVKIRRGTTARIDNASDLTFTSDGDIGNPIIIEAAFADEWSDDVDLSATATATLTFGSKTITFSSDISGVLAAGDWIYAASDDAKEFSYEVASVSTVTVTLYLPYKGGQAGSGKTMTNMQSAPIWNTTAGDYQTNLDNDRAWKIQGVHFRGTDTNGVMEIDSCMCQQFIDCIFESDGSDRGIYFSDDAALFLVDKCRFYNYSEGIIHSQGSGWFAYGCQITNSLFDGNSATDSAGVLTYSSNATDFLEIIESEFKNHAAADISFGNSGFYPGIDVFKTRNCIFSSTTDHEVIDQDLSNYYYHFLNEDYDNTVGDSRQFSFLNYETVMVQSETTKVRSGGSNVSIKVTPSANMGNTPFGRLKLFDLPIYTTTSSKTYTVYFASDTTTEWTTGPTASELWIELEAWGHASNNFRKITKSTGTVDFTTDTDFDQSLAVTVAPAQAGVAYLRCYYAKTKEASKTNIFYVDPIPVIS